MGHSHVLKRKKREQNFIYLFIWLGTSEAVSACVESETSVLELSCLSEAWLDNQVQVQDWRVKPHRCSSHCPWGKRFLSQEKHTHTHAHKYRAAADWANSWGVIDLAIGWSWERNLLPFSLLLPLAHFSGSQHWDWVGWGFWLLAHMPDAKMMLLGGRLAIGIL